MSTSAFNNPVFNRVPFNWPGEPVGGFDAFVTLSIDLESLLTLIIDLETTITLLVTVADMAVENVDIGDVVRVKATFTNDAGAVVDPTAITFIVADPLNGLTQYAYGSAVEVTRLSLGVYRLKFQPSLVGTHVVRVEGTGAAVAAEPASFRVRSKFQP